MAGRTQSTGRLAQPLVRPAMLTTHLSPCPLSLQSLKPPHTTRPRWRNPPVSPRASASSSRCMRSTTYSKKSCASSCSHRGCTGEGECGGDTAGQRLGAQVVTKQTPLLRAGRSRRRHNKMICCPAATACSGTAPCSCPPHRQRRAAVGLAAAGPQHNVGAEGRAAAEGAEGIHHFRQHVGVEGGAAQQRCLGGCCCRGLAGRCCHVATHTRRLLSLLPCLCRLLPCSWLCRLLLAEWRELGGQLRQGRQHGAGRRVQLTSRGLKRHQQLAEAAAAQ